MSVSFEADDMRYVFVPANRSACKQTEWYTFATGLQSNCLGQFVKNPVRLVEQQNKLFFCYGLTSV